MGIAESILSPVEGLHPSYVSSNVILVTTSGTDNDSGDFGKCLAHPHPGEI